VIEQRATVVAVEGGTAWVAAPRRGACARCARLTSRGGGCGAGLWARALGVRPTCMRAENPVGARVGDQVVVGLEEAALLRGSALLYLLPLAALLAGALAGQALAGMGGEGEAGALAGGAAGLAAALAWLRRRGGRLALDPRWRPVILRVLPEAPGCPGEGDEEQEERCARG